MKLSRIFGLGLLATMSLVSCSEDLLTELPPKGILIDQAIENEQDLKVALNGMYNHLTSVDSFGADITVFGDLISDNAFVSQTNDGYYVTTQQMSWTGDNAGDFNLLDVLYDAVAMANMVINEGAKLEQTPGVQNIIGEAHLGRALAFFTLVNFYSANPTSGKFQEYGIPIYTGDYDPNGLYPRATVSETYNQIISDLETSLAKMNVASPASKAYFSPTVANFVMSKVYLTRGESGDYAKAIEFSNKVLNNSPANYQLLASEDYADYFTNPDISISENADETIWEIEWTALSNPGVNSALGAFFAYNGNHRSILMRQNFYALFDNSDVRKALFRTNGVPTTDEPLGVWTTKHPRGNSESNFAMNTKVFRMTEALFVKWEAMAKSGQGAQALTEVNDFAVSRGGSTYSGDALEAVLAEKRKEFFAEGVRFFDLKRNNLPINKVTNCFGTSCSVPANDRLFVLPIPRGEMNLNASMTQYPEW